MDKEFKLGVSLTTTVGLAPDFARPRWKALFAFTTRAHLSTLIAALFLTLGSGIVIPALAYFLGLIFDSFTNYALGTITGDALIRMISLDALYLVALGLVSWLLNGTYFSCWIIFGELQAKSARDNLYNGMLQKEMQWFDTRKSGISTMIPRLQAQIRELQIATSQPLGFALQYLVTMIAALGLALYSAWDLTLITIASLPIGAALIAWTSSRMQPAIESQLKELDSASKTANNAIHNIDIVKCFNGQNSELWRYSDSIKKGARYYLSVARGNAFQIGFVRLLMLTMFVQGFWYGSHVVDTGRKTAGQILTAFWACLMATQTVEQILPQMIVLEKGRTAGATLEAVLTKMDMEGKTTSLPGTKTPEFCDGEITIRDVSFSYPSRPHCPALSNATFHFPAGDTTFVVGKSGSGKSTLSNILLQFYRPDSGQITMDGEQLQDLDRKWLRNNVTLVQQETVLFNETLLNNIVFGYSGRDTIERHEVKSSVDLSGLMDTIFALPNGLETVLGSGGTALSGGQRQRVAIARARLRDTPVLILDEATSSLDPTSRIKVMEEIRKWRQGKTTIIITHDLSQVLENDYMYVMEKGRVVQEGYRSTLTRSTGGPLAGFLSLTTTLPKIVIGGSRSQPEILDSTPLSPVLASPPSSISSNDSINVHLADRSSVVPKAFYSTPNKYRQSSDFSASLSPLAAHLSTMSNSRRSMQSLQSTSRVHSAINLAATSKNHLPLDEDKSRVEAWNESPVLPAPVPPPKDLSKWPKRLSTRFTAGRAPQALGVTNDNVRPYGRSPGAKNPRQINSLRHILDTVWPNLRTKHRAALVSGFVAAGIHAAATPVFSYAFANLLSTFFTTIDQRPKKALIWSCSILGVAVVDGFASYMMHYLLEMSGQAWVDKLRIEATQRILDQPRSWFDDDSNGLQELVTCLDRCAEEMRNLIGRFMGFLSVAIIMILVAVTWCLCLSWKLTLVGAAAAPVLYSITRGFELTSGAWEGKSNDAGDAAGGVFSETFGNIRTIQALTLEAYFHRKYFQATTVALRVGLKRALFSGIFFGISDASVVLTTALVFWFGSLLASQGQIPVQNIITVFTMLLFSIANANSIVAFIPQINSSRDTATQLLRLANLPLRKSHEHTGHIRLSVLPGSITLRNLTFSYPSRPLQTVLSSINLNIPLRKSTALVGPSGSGKSTIVSLIMGLYPVKISSRDSKELQGITIGDHSLSSLHLPTFRSLIGYVPQQTNIFPGTIAANITYGLNHCSQLTTQSSIIRAAAMTGIDAFIGSLPEGYATLIGEGGTTLSGGQVQRLAIARAIVRRPELLILDEPTSSLDSTSAEEIRLTITNLVKGGMTVLMVTHNHEMMREMDGIIVLEEGSVVEEGTWQELMSKERGQLRTLLGAPGGLT